MMTTLSQDDISHLFEFIVKAQGLVKHHIDSYNRMIREGIKQIIEEVFTVTGEIDNPDIKDYKKVLYKIEFVNTEIVSPEKIIVRTDSRKTLYPIDARQSNRTYSSPITVSANIDVTVFKQDGTEEQHHSYVEDYPIGSIPIMVGSDKCNTMNKPKNVIRAMNMDPSDKGGYFILKGGEWSIDNSENIVFGDLRTYHNRYSDEIARAEILSKPGDNYENSFETIFRFLISGEITLTFNMTDYNRFRIPFYLIYRYFGIAEEEKIIQSIVDTTSDLKIDKLILDDVKKAFLAKNAKDKTDTFNLRDPVDIAIYFAKNMSKRFERNEEIMKALRNDTLQLDRDTSGKNEKILDLRSKIVEQINMMFMRNFLPHLGETDEARPKKLAYIGYAINKLIKTKYGLIESTDREALKNKRVHVSGESYAKIFKTQFNRDIITSIRRYFRKNLKSKRIDDKILGDMFRSSIKERSLEQALEKAITSSGSSKSTTSSRRDPNRLTSQIYHRKNQLNTIAISRGVSTVNASIAKSTERADMMRRVHPSYVGFLCVSRTVDTGEKVGLQKEMAISCRISAAEPSHTLKDRILRDPDMTPLSDNITDLPKRMFREKAGRIFVNGDLLGTTNDTLSFANKYRELRRRNTGVHRDTTIYWDILLNEVRFYVCPGRLLRPLLIVYNEGSGSSDVPAAAATKNKPFHQYIKYTPEHTTRILEGKLTLEDLFKEGILEYISAGEQENILLARSYKYLYEQRHNELKQFTHCEIEQSVVGLSALTSAMGNNNQAPRITFQTNQSKQTNGIACADYPHHFLKEFSIQIYNEQPVVETIANSLTLPNGCNCFLAVANYAGFNQEDSAVMCQASADRELFTASKSTYVMGVIKEATDHFGKPDPTVTKMSKRHANYSNIKANGFPAIDLIKKNDIVIGMYGESKDKNYKYVDKSIIWEHDEDALITQVAFKEDGNPMVNEDDNVFAKVKLTSYRPVEVGDKFSSRSGQKMIVGAMPRKSDMPFTEDGIIPDIIMNPHALPTRMTIGQMQEGHVSKLCAIRNSTVDGTIFKTVDVEKVADELEKHGFHRYGYERMYDGITGCWIDSLIFITPLFMQRLQKYAVDALHGVAYARTCQVTHQPLEGKSQRGGLKVGEMEKDAWVAQGAGKVLQEKFFDFSDGEKLYICRKCHYRAIVNTKQGLYRCNQCGVAADIAEVNSSWTANMFFTYLNAMGADMKFHV